MKNKNTIGPSIHNVEPFFISQFYQNSNKSILYIGKDEREISSMEQKIKWLLPDVEILLFKSWDQIPYDNVSPSKEVQIERLKRAKLVGEIYQFMLLLSVVFWCEAINKQSEFMKQCYCVVMAMYSIREVIPYILLREMILNLAIM